MGLIDGLQCPRGGRVRAETLVHKDTLTLRQALLGFLVGRNPFGMVGDARQSIDFTSDSPRRSLRTRLRARLNDARQTSCALQSELHTAQPTLQIKHYIIRHFAYKALPNTDTLQIKHYKIKDTLHINH